MLELDGEDAHLAPVVDRVKAMRDLKARIAKSRVVWPKGITAASFAESLACDPILGIGMKRTIAEHLARHKQESCDAVEAQVPNWQDRGRKNWGFNSRFLAAVGSGQIPSVFDLGTSEDVDNYVAIADDPGTVLRVAITFSELQNYQTPDSVIRRALEVNEIVAPLVLYLAEDAVKAGRWPIARRRVLQVFESPKHPTWTPLAASFLRDFSQTCVQSGLASEAAELLKEAGMDDRLLPLYEALRAAAAGPGASLAYLAPEVRAPTEDLLKFLREPAPPPESPVDKHKPKLGGQGKRRTGTTGTQS